MHDQSTCYLRPNTANRSTEIALIKVKSDILDAVDRQEVTFLVLLDLSAAFDTVDHAILLLRLYQRIGICETALQWIESYLSSKTSSICIDGHCSTPSQLKYGVPQGSVKGPLDFIMGLIALFEMLKLS